MNTRLKNALNFYVLMMCGIVGVGFISGAEIYEFFARFESFSYFGIVIFILLIFSLSYKILSPKSNYKKYLKLQIKTNNKSKNTFLNKNNFKSMFVFINVLLISSAMISGLKVFSKKILNNNYILILALCLFFVFIVLVLGVKGLEKVDWFVLIFIIFVSAIFVYDILFFKNKINITTSNFPSRNNAVNIIKPIFASGIFSALYVFMNIVQAEPLKIESKINFSKKQAIIFSIIFSISLTILLLIFMKFLWVNKNLCNYPMPFLEYFTAKSGWVSLIYIIGLFLAIITTLLSCLIGVKQGINKVFGIKCCGLNTHKRIFTKNEHSYDNDLVNIKLSKTKNEKFKQNLLSSFVSLLLAFVLSFINFNTFVSVIYPIIGAINFVIFVFL